MKRTPVIINCIAALFFLTSTLMAQTPKKSYFNAVSAQNTADKNYGVVNIDAATHTLVIGTIMASGENVKGLNIQINNGFTFKLAPAQNGAVLNYVGSTLNIVLQPGDKAKIDFTTPAKGPSVRQIYVAGETID